jgi:hypothetical protein
MQGETLNPVSEFLEEVLVQARDEYGTEAACARGYEDELECYARQEEPGGRVRFWVANLDGDGFHEVAHEPNVEMWEPVESWTAVPA